MKIFISILSVYILILTATPCIDAVHANVGRTTEHSESANDNHTPGRDHCSPFCICQCCATPVVFMNYTVQTECFSFSQTLLSKYTSTYISSLSVAIWQPPKELV